jgi:hypothetical protein
MGEAIMEGVFDFNDDDDDPPTSKSRRVVSLPLLLWESRFVTRFRHIVYQLLLFFDVPAFGGLGEEKGNEGGKAGAKGKGAKGKASAKAKPKQKGKPKAAGKAKAGAKKPLGKKSGGVKKK